MTERSSPNVALVALVAGMAGAAVALLFAPKSGKETRAMLADKASKMREKAASNLQDLKGSVDSGIDQAKDTFSSAIQSVSKKAEEENDDLKAETKRTRQSPVLNAWEEEV